MGDEKPIDLTTGGIRSVHESDVWDALRQCYDPEIPVNVVDLGLIYEMTIEGSTVQIKMTLTAPGCGMGPIIANDVKSRVGRIPGVEKAIVELVFTPTWNPSMMTEAARLELGIT